MPTLKGTEVSLSYVQCFLYLVSSSIDVSIFHITWLDTFWTDLVYILLKEDDMLNLTILLPSQFLLSRILCTVYKDH